MQTQHAPFQKTLSVIGALITILAIGHGACVEDQSVDPETWTLRDTLGLSPEWFTDMPDAERRSLERRLTDTAVLQSQDDLLVDLLDDADPPTPVPDDTFESPRRALSELDARLDVMAQQPLLIQRTRYSADTPEARACTLDHADFTEPLQEDEIAQARDITDGWHLDDAFERPLNPDNPQGETELDALDARLPAILRWITRCAPLPEPSDAQPDDHALSDEAPPAALHIQRAQGAPALISYWPQGPRLYINPALLALWPELTADPSPRQGALRTLAQTLEQNAFSACMTETIAYCEQCDTPEEAADNNCLQSLMAGYVVDNCQALASVQDGFARYCLNKVLLSQGPSLRQCLAVIAAEDPSCDPANAVFTADSLDVHASFVDNPACLDALDACLPALTQGSPKPEDDVTPPPARPENLSPGLPDDDDDTACVNSGCELSLGIAEACGESSDDSGGCEGDSGGGGGCEGDTVDGASGCEGDGLDGAAEGAEGCSACAE